MDLFADAEELDIASLPDNVAHTGCARRSFDIWDDHSFGNTLLYCREIAYVLSKFARIFELLCVREQISEDVLSKL